MALTIEEVFAQWQPPGVPNGNNTEMTVVLTTLVITQEDGHTSWGQAELGIDPVAKTVSRGIVNFDPSNDFVSRFSDNLWTGLGQRQGIKIFDAGNQVISLTLILKEWGNAEVVLPLQLTPDFSGLAKIYHGWGQTIGGGSGAALYCISFNQIERLFVDDPL
jgi:hypothetical protein